MQASFSLTPTRRIVATALRPPLLVSHTDIHFNFSPAFLDETPRPLQHKKVHTLNHSRQYSHTSMLTMLNVIFKVMKSC